MAHYSTLLADRRSLPYFPEDRLYYSTSGRSAQWTPEPSSRTSHYIPTPASFVSPWNAVNFTSQPEYNSRSAPPHYPASSHRTVPSPPYPDSSRGTVESPPCLLDALSVYTPPFTRPASRATVSDAYSTPYADPNATSPESSASPPPPPVKEEQPDDDGFIIDLPSALLPQMLAPPTEVPLRATQASAHMRRMMGVFRLNPFAMHAHGGRGVLAPWAGGEAGPLDEEPRIFEFQLELLADEATPKLEEQEHTSLDVRPRPFSLDAPGLRAFSPDFELDAERNLNHQNHEPESNWELGYPSLSVFDPVSAYPRALHPNQTNARLPPPIPPRRWSLPHASDPGFIM
ncbi:hypothetical protein MVEN_00747800 [Mycena venus]|uniref:Uncharacterized protein n=1 Tax=Mycena venus TaxID=2733690 RepID=A0A8H7D611_9AGAR|nr:hypothetical protein MVEN_00747800 [Mycena venus]